MKHRPRFPVSKKTKRTRKERKSRKNEALAGLPEFATALAQIGASVSVRDPIGVHWIIFLCNGRRIEWWPGTSRCVVEFDYHHPITCSSQEQVLLIARSETVNPTVLVGRELDAEFAERIASENP